MIYLELFLTFFKIGLFGFGGGYAMISMIQDEALKFGIQRADFIDIIAVAEMTPGPIGLNVSTFTGYKAAGIPGAAVATFSNILPCFILVIAGLFILRKFLKKELYNTFFSNFRLCVTGLVASVVILLGQAIKIHTDYRNILFALGGFILCYYKIHPIIVLIIAGTAGYFIF
ncbi:MAG: chromate transporter [Candidatus Muiribacteriota bacterium]